MGPGEQLAQYYNTPELQAAKAKAQEAGQTAVNYASAAGLLPTKLREAIQNKVNYNQDIIKEQNEAMADYFAAPSQARVDYQNIWNPFEREKLVARATSNAYAPYATLTDALGQRMGRIDDIVSAGTGAFNAGVTASQGAYDLLRQDYTDQLSLADTLAGIAKWDYEQKKSGSGGFDLSSLFGTGGGTTGGLDLYEWEATDGLTSDSEEKPMAMDFTGMKGLNYTGNNTLTTQPAQTGGGVDVWGWLKRTLQGETAGKAGQLPENY